MAADYARRTATRGTDDDQVAAMIRRLADRLLAGRTLPVLTVLATLVVLWYGFAVYLNAPWQRDVYARAKTEWTAADLVRDTLNQERPVLPAAHQVFAELWATTVGTPVHSKRSSSYHGWITLSSPLLGFAIGTEIGIASFRDRVGQYV